MNLLSTIFLSALLVVGWDTDFEDAKKKAGKENKLILLSFSGSDWCKPCIDMHREIFEPPTFTEFADQNLVLVNADFPRMSKNRLSPEQLKKNQKLAEQYDPEGIFPYTVLLNAEGKILNKWIGYPPISAQRFIDQVKPFLAKRK